jgi:hypothetical protein
MLDDVGTNEFLVRSVVQSGEQFYPTDTRACRFANLANVLDDVIEHYLPTALGGEAAPRDMVRARANLAAKLLTPESDAQNLLWGTSFTTSAEVQRRVCAHSE